MMFACSLYLSVLLNQFGRVSVTLYLLLSSADVLSFISFTSTLFALKRKASKQTRKMLGSMVYFLLRLLTEFFILVESVIFGATFDLVTCTCWITIIFGTTMIDNLEINSLLSNNCFLTKWRQRFVKTGFKKNSAFCPKPQILYISDHTI